MNGQRDRGVRKSLIKSYMEPSTITINVQGPTCAKGVAGKSLAPRKNFGLFTFVGLAFYYDDAETFEYNRRFSIPPCREQSYGVA